MFFDEVFDSELGAESRFGGAAQGRVDENARITPWALFFSRFLTTVLIFFLHLVRLRPWVAFSRAFALLLISSAHKVCSEAFFGMAGIFQASAKASGISFLVLLLIVLNFSAILSSTCHSESS